jgi:TP53 regulating kinase-like protein
MIRMVDVEAGMIGMEWIDGWSVREVLGGGAEGEEADPELLDDAEVDQAKLERRKEAEGALEKMGVSIGTSSALSPHVYKSTNPTHPSLA